MTATVIIPALRAAGTVRALELLEGQCESAIVVDNSTGEVEAAVQGFLPWVRIIRPGRNIGFGPAIHLAALTAREDLLVIVNDDVEPRPDFVRRMVEPFDDPDVDQVAGLLYIKGTDQVDTAGLAVDRTLRGENVKRLLAGRPLPAIIGPSGAAAAYRRTTYLALGGFVPELFAYWEDTDLALRFFAAGHGCAFTSSAVAEHARGTALAGRSARQRELDAFGRGFVLARYRGWLTSIDRLAVPIVDWPSTVRGCLVMRSLIPIRARRAGMAAGRLSMVPRPGDGRRPATRSIPATLQAQLVSVISGSRTEKLPGAGVEANVD